MLEKNEECIVCKGKAIDTICADCDNEYAEWLDAKGYKVGEFDTRDHPNYNPNVHKGTKWEVFDR